MAEKEYIEREALVEFMNECKNNDPFNIMATGYAMAFIEKVPAADVVEVVRCKDCKHSKIDNSGTTICILNSECDAETGVDYGFISYCSENHFCSYGERITNND